MSKRPQRGTCQQQPAAECQEGRQQQQQQQQQQPQGLGQAEPEQDTSENLDTDHKRTMTSQTRKRPRLGQSAGGEPVQSGDERRDEPAKLPEQQEMIDLPKGEVLVQELRVSVRRGRTQQLNKPAQPTSSPSSSSVSPQPVAPKCSEPDTPTPEAPRRPSPRPLTAANAGQPSACMKQNICAACKRPIRERYLLMALDKHWHEDCLKCACCDCRLGEVGSSLFTHSDKILCRRDFLRIFGQHGHCAACKRSIPPYELVMRANELAYHMDCFACQQCQYRFCVGDRFYLAEAHKIICLRCHSEQTPLMTPPQAAATTATATATTTTTSSFTLDQNNLQAECVATSTSTSAAAAALGRLDPTVCSRASGQRPSCGSGQPGGAETKPAIRDGQLGEQPEEGSGAGRLEAGQVESNLAPQQQVAAAAAAALQPGDQKQACAV